MGRAWAIKAFSKFWNYRYAGPARKFFDRWYFWASHSHLPPIVNAAKTLKRHIPGLLAYTKHRITNAAAEGTNGRIRLPPILTHGAIATPPSTVSAFSSTVGALISTPRAVRYDRFRGSPP